MKTCTKCGEEKPATPEFWRRDRGTFQARCKECLKNGHGLRPITDAEMLQVGRQLVVVSMALLIHRETLAHD